MGRHIRWPAIITFTGIALTLAFLGYLSFSRTTITTVDTQGAYREAVVGLPQYINPLLAPYNWVDQDLSALIFNGLTRSDGRGGLEPDLAESWERSDDGQIYLFKLRQGVRWQDNEPFTADDVIFTLNLMQDPQFPGVPYLHDLWQSVTVQKLDDFTIRFTLTEPVPAFADFTTIGILPAHLLEDVTAAELLEHPFNLSPIGTGPFKLDEITQELARLSPNPFYRGPSPRLHQIELHFYRSYQACVTAYEAGAVEAISFIPPEAIPYVQSLESLTLYTARLSGYKLIYLNLQSAEMAPFFAEVKVRQALLAGLDRQALIDQALNGQGLVATGPILPWSWAYNPKLSKNTFDLDQANRLLDEAGWVDHDGDGVRDKEGQSLTFTFLTNNNPTNIVIANTIREQWQRINISATVEIVGAGLNERLQQHNFQAALAEIRLSGDPDPYPLWHQSQIEEGQNYAGWSHDRASQLLETARSVTDTGPRNDAYYEFQEIFAEEVPAILLYYPIYSYGVDRSVLGVQLGPLTTPSDRFRTLSAWYMLTEQVILSESQFQETVQPVVAK